MPSALVASPAPAQRKEGPDPEGRTRQGERLLAGHEHSRDQSRSQQGDMAQNVNDALGITGW